LQGVSDPAKVAPDGYMLDYLLMQRPGNKQIQYQLKYDYRFNFPLYAEWQAFLRRYQPPTLVVWGENDPIFTKEGALGLPPGCNRY
jgi:pimeloyl-ACP methyl ester carboxylesterase